MSAIYYTLARASELDEPKSYWAAVSIDRDIWSKLADATKQARTVATNLGMPVHVVSIAADTGEHCVMLKVRPQKGCRYV